MEKGIEEEDLRSMVVPAIIVHPETALVDEEQIISVQGLAKHQYISVHVRTAVESGTQFASLGCFRADEDGIVDISQDESIQGTYTGVDSMGLFWSLKAEPGFEKRRFMKTDVSAPLVYNIFVYKGIYTLDEIQNCPKACVATTSICRFYKDKKVKRIKIREEMVVGALFIPHGKGPFPAVIDMFGGVGGLVELRAALLASRGFLTLALPYVFYDDLPSYKKMYKNFSYFKENIEWLERHPLAIHGGIGVVGVSAGGYIANILALMFKQVKACVLINCPTYYPIRPVYMDSFYKQPVTIESTYDLLWALPRGFVGDLFLFFVSIHYMYQSREYEHFPPICTNIDFLTSQDPARFEETSEGIVTNNMYPHYEERISKSWESSAKFLCILGGDDRCVDPSYIENWYSKWPPDQKHRIKIHKYKDAGHLIEPPFTPLNRVTFSKVLNDYQVWGGKPEGHAYSQTDSWKQIITFLKENLIQPHLTKSNL